MAYSEEIKKENEVMELDEANVNKEQAVNNNAIMSESESLEQREYDEKMRLQIEIIKKKIKQGELKEAKRMTEKILNGFPGIKYRIILMEYLVKIAKKSQKSKNARKIAKKIYKIEKLEEEREKMQEQMGKEMQQKEDGKTIIKETGFEEIRNDLYEGTIDVNQLKQLIDEYSSTMVGCIFIAEVCKYFNIEETGLKWVRGIRKNNSEISDSERKALLGAEELLMSKNIIASKQDKWNNVYGKLQREQQAMQEEER